MRRGGEGGWDGEAAGERGAGEGRMGQTREGGVEEGRGEGRGGGGGMGMGQRAEPQRQMTETPLQTNFVTEVTVPRHRVERGHGWGCSK